MNDYQRFIEQKTLIDTPSGFEPGSINPALFPWQAEIVRYACMRGRFGGYEDCGLGKSIQQLESARLINEHTGLPVMIFAPLAVAEQTKREARKFDIQAEVRVCKDQSHVGNCINVANYERLHLFEPEKFGGVLLDEGSILKSIDGKIRGQLLNDWQCVPYRQSWSATPAPNDFMEIGNQAEFLGVMKRSEMLATFFVHDGGDTSKWRLKGHAREAFWRWMASWCVMVRRPSDLGHDGTGYDLPPINYHEHYTESKAAPGQLFALNASTLSERRAARRASLTDRCEEAARIVSTYETSSVVWCNLNDEGDMLEDMIHGSVQVAGADSEEFKEAAIEWFLGELCVCACQGDSTKVKIRNHCKGIKCGRASTQRTGNGNTQNQLKREKGELLNPGGRKKTKSTCKNTTKTTSGNSNLQTSSELNETGDAEKDTQRMLNTGSLQNSQAVAERKRSGNESSGRAVNTEYPSSNTTRCMNPSAVDVQSAKGKLSTVTEEDTGYTSTTATTPEKSEDCSARAAISDSESSRIPQRELSKHCCTCGHQSGRRILISKCKIFGFGLNLQHCPTTVIFPTDSWEQWYQMVRRFWRFGQEQEVNVHAVASESERAVIENLKRKEQDAGVMFDGIAAAMSELSREQIQKTERQTTTYTPNQEMEIPQWLTA